MPEKAIAHDTRTKLKPPLSCANKRVSALGMGCCKNEIDGSGPCSVFPARCQIRYRWLLEPCRTSAIETAPGSVTTGLRVLNIARALHGTPSRLLDDICGFQLPRDQ